MNSHQARAGAIALLLLACLALGFGGGWLGARSDSQTTEGANTVAQQQIVKNESNLISAIAKQVGPSVVSVNVTSQGQQQDIFGFSQPVQQQSAGTGIIVSSDGYIITNRHVVPAGSTSVTVTLSDGTTLDSVSVVGETTATDPIDIAVLKVKDAKGEKLTPAKLGDSSTVQVGDRVVAIGNALGQFQNTVTSGIISGFGRTVQAGDQSGASSENLQDLFQTDAAINEGNSGGPLLDANGQVIGINTAIAGNAQNIGFAIPINDIQGIIKTVLSSGKFERPYMGIRYVTLTGDYAYYYNLSIKSGAYIPPSSNGLASIVSGSPADKAGLQEKDIITAVDNVALDQTHTLTDLLGLHSVGEKVTLTINRGGKTMNISVTLETEPQS